MAFIGETPPANDFGHSRMTPRQARQHARQQAQLQAELKPRRKRYQFRLSSVFILTAVAAFLCNLAHYLGGMVLLRHMLFAGFTIFLLTLVFVGPLFVIEFFIFVLEAIFGLAKSAPLPGRRRFD